MFRGIQAPELLIILVIVLLIFGARKLPDLARSLGASAKEFRKGINEGSGDEADAQSAESQAVEPSVADTPAGEQKKPE